MSVIAHCSGCGRYVELTHMGECPDGHPRSALRDIREGKLSAAPVVRTASSVAVAEHAAFRAYDNPITKIIGKAIIIVPIALVLGFGLWTGMLQPPGVHMSFWTRLGWSVFSLAMTVGGAFMIARRRHR